MSILGLIFFSLILFGSLYLIWALIAANGQKISMALAGHVAWEPIANEVYRTAIERRRVRTVSRSSVAARRARPEMPLAA